MEKSELAVGQIITIGMEVEFWNHDETVLDWRTDRWDKWEIVNITSLEDSYAVLELRSRAGIVSDVRELDVDYDDIELA